MLETTRMFYLYWGSVMLCRDLSMGQNTVGSTLFLELLSSFFLGFAMTPAIKESKLERDLYGDRY